LARRNRETDIGGMGYVTLSRVTTGTRGAAQSFEWDGNLFPSAKRFAESSVFVFGHSKIQHSRVCYDLGCSAFLRGVTICRHSTCMLTAWGYARDRVDIALNDTVSNRW
jgi:hypothetical protein